MLFESVAYNKFVIRIHTTVSVVANLCNRCKGFDSVGVTVHYLSLPIE